MEVKILKAIIKETVKEALQEERLSLLESLIPPVNNQEMQEIVEKFDSPSNYDEDEFVDMAYWLNYETET